MWFHSFGAGCEKDDNEHCGSHDKACYDEHGTTQCVAGQCQIDTCNDGYHIFETICESDSREHCGSHDIDCTNMTGGKGECRNGSCAVTTCNADYHLFDNTCEKDDDDHCGDHANKCPIGAVCKDKECLAQTCSEYTNALRCTDTGKICRIPANKSTYECIDESENNANCFVNDKGTPGSCTSYKTQGRDGVTGTCIYDPSKADPDHRGWRTKGWTCECNPSTAEFELHCYINNDYKYCCKL